eukprot:360003-Chlamydomonas_euryale.AAC.10
MAQSGVGSGRGGERRESSRKHACGPQDKRMPPHASMWCKRLSARLPACLPACLPARLPACLPACRHAPRAGREPCPSVSSESANYFLVNSITKNFKIKTGITDSTREHQHEHEQQCGHGWEHQHGHGHERGPQGMSICLSKRLLMGMVTSASMGTSVREHGHVCERAWARL